jgi:glyoxylase-like metal-dependent hydrolase (beta-lactamase superfamily II)
MNEYSPNLWLNEINLGSFTVRGGLMIGNERALVWDTLSHPRDMQPYLPLIQGKDLLIVYSHADWDHIWGTAGLANLCRVIIGHEICLKRFYEDVTPTLKEKKAAEPKVWDEVKLIAPNLTFSTDLNIDLGEMMVTFHTLPGHTPDAIVAFLPEQGILLGGDTLETPFPVVNDDSPVEQWIENLSRWEKDKRVKTVIPAHGVIGGPEIIRNNIKYLKSLLDGTKAQIPYEVDSFYKETHQSNMRNVKRN